MKIAVYVGAGGEELLSEIRRLLGKEASLVEERRDRAEILGGAEEDLAILEAEGWKVRIVA